MDDQEIMRDGLREVPQLIVEEVVVDRDANVRITRAILIEESVAFTSESF